MQVSLASNYQLHYQLIPGDKTKPYLVFLHEGLGCISLWKQFPELLCEATGCPGLVYDRRGYGKSVALAKERTIHYIHEYALQELPQVIAALIPDRQFIIVGHSDGGSIGLIYAAEQTENLLGLITEAAHVFVEPETLAGIKLADQAWDAGKLVGLVKYHGTKTEQIFKAWSTTWQKSYFKHWNIEYLLPSIEVPLLAIQGIDDQYGSLQQIVSIEEKSVRGSSQLLENCAHVPHLEAQAETLAIMRCFVNNLIN